MYLLSRRPQDKQFSPLAVISFQGNIPKHPDNVLLRFNDLNPNRRDSRREPQEFVNTLLALQKAREMLQELSL